MHGFFNYSQHVFWVSIIDAGARVCLCRTGYRERHGILRSSDRSLDSQIVTKYHHIIMQVCAEKHNICLAHKSRIGRQNGITFERRPRCEYC